jgi:1-aminocyclopropane-1-carboxylate deaminase/D-cysteine desulfhydrase-like pyridoxal-dependent ACC family enzyme
VLLDPAYTAKAMAALIAAVRAGCYQADQAVVFVHTGGTPALFAYAGALEQMLPRVVHAPGPGA